MAVPRVIASAAWRMWGRSSAGAWEAPWAASAGYAADSTECGLLAKHQLRGDLLVALADSARSVGRLRCRPGRHAGVIRAPD